MVKTRSGSNLKTTVDVPIEPVPLRYGTVTTSASPATPNPDIDDDDRSRRIYIRQNAAARSLFESPALLQPPPVTPSVGTGSGSRPGRGQCRARRYRRLARRPLGRWRRRCRARTVTAVQIPSRPCARRRDRPGRTTPAAPRRASVKICSTV